MKGLIIKKHQILDKIFCKKHVQDGNLYQLMITNHKNNYVNKAKSSLIEVPKPEAETRHQWIE